MVVSVLGRVTDVRFEHEAKQLYGKVLMLAEITTSLKALQLAKTYESMKVTELGIVMLVMPSQS